jgi:hypothetical protein
MTVALATNPGDRDERHSQEARRSHLRSSSAMGPDATCVPMNSNDEADFERVLPDRRVGNRLLRLLHEYGVQVAPQVARRSQN